MKKVTSACAKKNSSVETVNVSEKNNELLNEEPYFLIL